MRYNFRPNVFPFLFFLIVLTGNNCVPIDNGLTGDPDIKCEQDSILVMFNTKNAFDGNLYVNGRFNDNACKVLGNSKNQNQIQVSYSGSCGLRRRRQVSPMGMTVETTVVIMFHKSVVTKVDRAFNIQCFYMQADKTVTANFDVSMIPTVPLNSAVTMPNCTYEVLLSPTGPPVKYANVGDAVYHKWNCIGRDAEMFCITVHNCVVDDGQGQSLVLIDNEGCAQDKYLLQNLEYVSDTMAARESHVFKFADKPTLYFNCQIRLEMKETPNGVCARPDCPQLTRGKRHLHFFNNTTFNSTNATTDDEMMNSFDVYANKLTVLDIKEFDSGISSNDKNDLDKTFCNQIPSFSNGQNHQWCLKPSTALMILILGVCVMFLFGSIFGASVVIRYKLRK